MIHRLDGAARAQAPESERRIPAGEARADTMLISLSAQLEAARPWAQRRAPIHA